MYLVDTSVWIDFFKGHSTPAVERLASTLKTSAEIGISTMILQEILQGTANEQQFAKYRSYFESQRIYLPLNPIQTAIAAAGIYFACRRCGITVRSTNDCLIAQMAIEHNLILLHNDADFCAIASVISNLREISS